jgi:hypothetical protein
LSADLLFHVSEEPDISVFRPRPPPSPLAGVAVDVVWAIDDAHLGNYLTPRDCPRVTFGRGPSTTDADAARFLSGVTGRVVIIESAWLDRALTTPIHVYAFERGPQWRQHDPGAGYFTSPEPVVPASVRRIDQPIAAMLRHGCELRVCANLWAMIDLVTTSTLEFSIIRKRNALPRPV